MRCLCCVSGEGDVKIKKRLLLVWRLLWWPVMALGYAVFTLGVCLAYGPDSARQAWKDMP